MKFTKIAAVLGVVSAVALSAAQEVLIRGKAVAFDSAPKMVNGVLMVPIRSIFDAMGADMRWKMDRQVIEGLRKGNKVEIWVGNKEARANDKTRTMDEPPYEWHGRTYAPLKFLAETMGYMISMEHGAYVLQEVKK
jgi:hypothetical protein